MNRIEEIKLRKEKALADGSFFLRVPTWLTAGDGRDFCAFAPDDIEFLLDKLALAVEALDAANGVIDLLTAYNVGVSFLSEERVELAMEKYRAALEKLRGEK